MYNAGPFSLDHDMYRRGYARRAGIVSTPGYRMSPMQLARRVAPVVASAAYKAYTGYKSKPRPPSNSNTISGRRRKAYMPKPKKSLKQQVKAIQKEIKTNQATLIYKQCGTGRVVQSAVGQQTINGLNPVPMSIYETILAELRFFNPSVPATLIQGSGASGTYDRTYHFKSVYTQTTLVNNYQIPVKVKLYCVSPREDTSITPITAFTNGLTDVGAPASTSPFVDVTDSPQFTKLWKIEKTVKKVLQPGQVLKASHSEKDIMYNPAIYDSHSLDYQKKYKCHYWFCRLTGVLAHDTAVTTEIGTAPCGVDFQIQNKFVVEYDAGVDLKFIVIADTSSTSFTNGGVVSSKPVSDNIGYSQA